MITYKTNSNAVLGQIFHMYRISIGLDQYEAAILSNLSRSTMSKLESGAININIEHILTLSKIYKVKASDVIEKLELIIHEMNKQGILFDKEGESNSEILDLSNKQILAIINSLNK